jgi:hypothetical protein
MAIFAKPQTTNPITVAMTNHQSIVFKVFRPSPTPICGCKGSPHEGQWLARALTSFLQAGQIINAAVELLEAVVVPEASNEAPQSWQRIAPAVAVIFDELHLGQFMNTFSVMPQFTTTPRNFKETPICLDSLRHSPVKIGI